MLSAGRVGRRAEKSKDQQFGVMARVEEKGLVWAEARERGVALESGKEEIQGAVADQGPVSETGEGAILRGRAAAGGLAEAAFLAAEAARVNNFFETRNFL